MGQWREREARVAAARMGIESRWIGLPESDWSDDEAREAIRAQLVEAAPTVIYAPSAIDYHPDHRRVARALAAAIAELQAQPEVRIYAIQVPLTPLLTGLVHDVSDLEVQVRSVLGCYASQRQSIAITTRLRRYAAQFYGASSEVEAFCSLPARDYIALQARPEAKFRPLMIRAWTDPLTLLVGLSERLSWRHARWDAIGHLPSKARLTSH
jgi:LmbE family N-acetylglucosaminyl deacetylase